WDRDGRAVDGHVRRFRTGDRRGVDHGARGHGDLRPPTHARRHVLAGRGGARGERHALIPRRAAAAGTTWPNGATCPSAIRPPRPVAARHRPSATSGVGRAPPHGETSAVGTTAPPPLHQRAVPRTTVHVPL